MAKSPETKPATSSPTLQEAFERLRGDIAEAKAAKMDVTHLSAKKALEKMGLPWTRENYIRFAWPVKGDLDDIEWDESEIPPDLQDWTKEGP